MATTAPTDQAGRRRGRRGRAADALVLAAILALLAFPVLARVAADRLPVAPAAPALPPARGADAPLRDLPAGLRGPPPRTLDDVRPAADALLGARRAERLLAAIRRPARAPVVPAGDRPPAATVDGLLPPAFSATQQAAATDLGARLTLVRGGAPAAYAVLARAGGCAAALDLLLLVAADRAQDAAAVTRHAESARRACPRDPTPLWVLTQFRSRYAVPGEQESPDRAATLRALDAGARLVREFPGSAAAWSGQADAYIRAAATQPRFVARRMYRRALAGYRRALALRPGPELEAGAARALAALGEPEQAVALQRRAAAALPGARALQVQLVAYLEAAHRFREAAPAAERLARVAGIAPSGPGRFPMPPHAAFDPGEPLRGPLSLGAARLAPLRVTLARPNEAAKGAFDVEDFAFIPDYRPMRGITSGDRWCADRIRRRALLLSGNAGGSLRGLAREFAGGPASCAGEPAPLLGAVAQLELGDRPGAQALSARVDRSSFGAPGPDDARQNLWRWAGDLAHAERAAREWTRTAPALALAHLRLAEIEFLRRRFDDAAADFGVASRRARDRARSEDEAAALLGRGAALVRAGRRAEALPALRGADDVASRALDGADDGHVLQRLRQISGYARLQLADSERLAHSARAAAEDYRAARERLPGNPALENNAAIVDVALGRLESAERATRRARATDRENPAYLMNAAYVAARAGRDRLAIQRNRAALAAQPDTFSAANDLGVLLAQRGDDDGAVAALRRAVGAEEDYALGWFNLGVVLARMGPRHLPASQGALGRAFALEPELSDRERAPTLDRRVYRTGLDVSRPLPPEWSFAASQKQAPVKTAGLAAALLAVFALGRTLAASRSGRGLAESWLGTVDRFGGRFLRRFRHPAIALVATLAVLAWPLARDPGGGVTAAAAALLALGVLVALVLRARAGAAQATWPPGVVLGAGAAAAGLTWAPLPVLGEQESAKRHWAAPVALAAVALPLVALTAWTDVPLARTLSVAALVMATSLLTPIKPVDGGAIAAAGGTAAGLSALALAALLALGLV